MSDHYYMHACWLHNLTDEPTHTYSENSTVDRSETRKVEVWRDGSLTAAGNGAVPNPLTDLGDQPIPSIHEIDALPEFTATEITKEEFEATWRRAIL